MPEETNAENQSDVVSREAHQRMTDDRNTLKAERDQLAATVLDMGYMDKARRHFADKGVDDPEWAATIALPSMKTADVEAESIGTYLDETFARLYPETPAVPADGVVDDGVPTPDATEPPGFARPSPAAPGGPAQKKVYSTSDPEVQAIIEANDTERFRQMVDAGTIQLRGDPPVNPG